MEEKKTSNILIIGHRGACGYEPENTLASFEKAIKLGAKMIEFDVYKCKSRDIVIIHDDKVNRTTNGSGYVWDKTLKELKNLKMKNNLSNSEEQKIPTLIEALNFINGRCKMSIELKGENTAQPVYEIIKKFVEEKKYKYDDFLVSSFNQCELLEFQKLTKKIKTGVCIVGIPADYSKFAKKLNVSSIHPSLEFINKKFVSDAHKNKIKIYVWTVNEKDDFERLKKIGIDGIFTNYPDKFIKK